MCLVMIQNPSQPTTESTSFFLRLPVHRAQAPAEPAQPSSEAPPTGTIFSGSAHLLSAQLRARETACLPRSLVGKPWAWRTRTVSRHVPGTFACRQRGRVCYRWMGANVIGPQGRLGQALTV